MREESNGEGRGREGEGGERERERERGREEGGRGGRERGRESGMEGGREEGGGGQSYHPLVLTAVSCDKLSSFAEQVFSIERKKNKLIQTCICINGTVSSKITTSGVIILSLQKLYVRTVSSRITLLASFSSFQIF